jgi:hypothetical protein
MPALTVLEIVDPGTLMIPNVKAPFSLAVFTAYKVSAVSPD